MNQKQKNKKDILLLFFFIFLIVSVTFITLVPKISSKIFIQKREMALDNFTYSVQTEKRINPQAYWKFREFYSPGYFDFSKSGVEKIKINNSLDNLKVNPKNIDYYFLRFNSNKLDSLDGFTKKSNLNQIINRKDLEVNELLFEKNDSIIYKNNEGEIYIIFLKTIPEMLKANGFYDHNNKKDISLMDGKYWFNVTLLK